MSQQQHSSRGKYDATLEDYSSDSSVEIIVDSNKTVRKSSLPPVLELSSRPQPLAKKLPETDYEYQMKFLSGESSDESNEAVGKHDEELRTCPLFSGDVLKYVGDPASSSLAVLPQYNLLARRFQIEQEHVQDLIEIDLGEQFFEAQQETQQVESHPVEGGGAVTPDHRIFLNVSAPWSAFICGSQGSGKSHTLSCILENCLIPSKLGKLPRPLAGMIFHYDRYSSYTSSQVCEAAYLCSAGVPVRVLVSPTNFKTMQQTYSNLPGLGPDVVKPEVTPLRLQGSHLNVERIMSLMSVSGKEGPTPLYIEVIMRVLRQMAIDSQGSPGLDYAAFREHLTKEGFSRDQNTPLRLRLELLDSFMEPLEKGERYRYPQKPKFDDNQAGKKARLAWEARENVAKIKWEQQAEEKRRKENELKSKFWSFQPGSLTIVDLSCPFVDDSAACAIFSICLALFLEKREDVGRIVALDEAHKFLKGTDAAADFTDNILQVIRQQRHLATRVIIATQEPTLSPKLLDLSTVTIVHRFTSPDWMQVLQAHLAAMFKANEDGKRDFQEIFKAIVNLDAGQAMVFSPTAILDIAERHDFGGRFTKGPIKLGMEYLKMRVRMRLTVDGGRSIMAV